MREERERNPRFEEEDGGLFDGTGDSRDVGRHGDMMIGLPDRNLKDLSQRLTRWPPEQREATVRKVLSLAGKLHRAVYVNGQGGTSSTAFCT